MLQARAWLKHRGSGLSICLDVGSGLSSQSSSWLRNAISRCAEEGKALLQRGQ